MKKFGKSILGVTLLEIMLVLAIAAMIIVMSVRYYQSATSNQQANSALQLIQGITAAADGLAQGTGSYAAISTTTVAPLLPGGGTTITSAWGQSVTIASSGTSKYIVTLTSTPAQVCALLASRLAGNTKFNVTSTCSTSAASFVYEYDATK